MSTINTSKRFTHNFKLTVIGFLALMGLAGVTQASYYFSADIRASAVNDISALRMLQDKIGPDEMRTEGDVRLSDSSSYGSAMAWAGGSLTSGTLRALTSATVTRIDQNTNTASFGFADARLVDSLTFNIPAGTYDTALDVTLKGNIAGTLSLAKTATDGVSFSKVLFLARLSAHDGVWFEWRNSDGNSFDQNFQITTTIVQAGTTFFKPSQAGLGFGAQLLAESTMYWFGEAKADFYDTSAVRFLSLDVPAGVTWFSESGQFLVPIPPALYLFGSGLLGLIGISRRKEVY